MLGAFAVDQQQSVKKKEVAFQSPCANLVFASAADICGFWGGGRGSPDHAQVKPISDSEDMCLASVWLVA